MWRTHSSVMPQPLPNMGNAAEVVGQTPWSARDASSRRTCTNGGAVPLDRGRRPRSEEHTSELQSLRHLVCRLLLEKKRSTQDRRMHLAHTELHCHGELYVSRA